MQDRLAAIEAELARLQSAYELAMSGFRFEEANRLQQRRAALEADRQALTAVLAPAPAAQPPTGVVPQLARPRRRR